MHSTDFDLFESNNCYLSETELILTIQEIDDDLRCEEATLTGEFQAVEIQLELKKCYFEDQIAEYMENEWQNLHAAAENL
jgi:hypothetical protein